MYTTVCILTFKSLLKGLFHYIVKLISIKMCYLDITESITLLLNVAFTILKTDLVTALTEFLKSFISWTSRTEESFYRIEDSLLSSNNTVVQRVCCQIQLSKVYSKNHSKNYMSAI